MELGEPRPNPRGSCGAREFESVIARPGESQGAKGKPRWSPAMPGEPMRCERKLRWSPAKPGEPIKFEMTTGDAWWSEKGTREAWRRRNLRENKETLDF